MDRRFLVSFALATVLFFGLYVWWYGAVLVKENPILPRSYKQFVMERLEGPRILIEGGSNAYHGIDGTLMESLTGYPVLVLADHASASLVDKIHRLERYGREGDFVILPLEWGFYFLPDLTELHLELSMGLLNNYYHSLPRCARMRRVFQTPLSVILRRWVDDPAHYRAHSYSDEMKRWRFFYDHNLAKSPFGGATDVERLREPVGESRCDDYLLGGDDQRTIELHADFRRSMRLLRRLQRRGLHVIVLPPVVVGDDCYQIRGDAFDALIAEAVKVFEAEGLPFLADFRRYVFPSSSFLNTHYHIDEATREEYTVRLTSDLVESGWLIPAEKPQPLLVDQVRQLLDEAVWDILEGKLEPWPGNPTELVKGVERHQFYLAEDWYEAEEWGRWAAASKAEVVFKPDPKKDFSAIHINARYFDGSEATRVYLNGEFAGAHNFEDDPVFSFGPSLRSWMHGTELIRMRFESSERISPAVLGLGADERELKFGIHSLQLVEGN